jgi:hypothetical protein
MLLSNGWNDMEDESYLVLEWSFSGSLYMANQGVCQFNIPRCRPRRDVPEGSLLLLGVPPMDLDLP